MTGPEHYAAAEALIRRIGACVVDSPETKALVASLAQVHATLALAAATVDASTGITREYPEWSGVTSR